MGLASLPFVYTVMLSPKHQERFVAFLHPEQYLSGAGFQIMNALYAIGSGGTFGKGWHQGTQNLLGFIPYDDNDFIFAVYSEEWGFFGALLLLGAFFLIIMLGLGIAARTREPFGRLVAVGVVVLFAVQVVINTGVTLHLMPVTGLTLPFVSYGGSSLLTCFIALGLLINVGMHKEPVLADEDFD
jgi:rod shape determining protein RodA